MGYLANDEHASKTKNKTSEDCTSPEQIARRVGKDVI
jgi:hypothetical protein